MTEYKKPVDYLPHRPPMVLLDRVISVSDTEAVCELDITRDSAAAPFLSEDGTLPAYFSLELISQTVGVWSGYQNQKAGRENVPLGMVLSARDLKSETAEYPLGCTLTVHIETLMSDGTIGSCQGEISIDGTVVSSGRVNVYQATQAQLAELFRR